MPHYLSHHQEYSTLRPWRWSEPTLSNWFLAHFLCSILQFWWLVRAIIQPHQPLFVVHLLFSPNSLLMFISTCPWKEGCYSHFITNPLLDRCFGGLAFPRERDDHHGFFLGSHFWILHLQTLPNHLSAKKLRHLRPLLQIFLQLRQSQPWHLQFLPPRTESNSGELGLATLVTTTTPNDCCSFITHFSPNQLHLLYLILPFAKRPVLNQLSRKNAPFNLFHSSR